MFRETAEAGDAGRNRRGSRLAAIEHLQTGGDAGVEGLSLRAAGTGRLLSEPALAGAGRGGRQRRTATRPISAVGAGPDARDWRDGCGVGACGQPCDLHRREIRRASCWERVVKYVYILWVV